MRKFVSSLFYDHFFQFIKPGSVGDTNTVIANYIIENHAQIKDHTIYTLSNACSVSPASVSRFIKNQGYESFAEFRDTVANQVDIYLNAYDYYPLDETPFQKPYSADQTHELTQMYAYRLEEAFNDERLEKLEEIAQAIMEADHLYILGQSAMDFITTHIVYELIIMGKYVQQINEVNEKSRFPKNSLLIVLSQYGYLFRTQKQEDIDLLEEKFDKVYAITQSESLISLDTLYFPCFHNSTIDNLVFNVASEQLIYLCRSLIPDQKPHMPVKDTIKKDSK